ncbi:scaffold protein Nfu/NifU N terminal-domain-containing protein [Abortiporus biennis]|nr:scaffold protein Nfu/NifU N terminal-domain-containing protein [Abortiporus biennis]
MFKSTLKKSFKRSLSSPSSSSSLIGKIEKRMISSNGGGLGGGYGRVGGGLTRSGGYGGVGSGYGRVGLTRGGGGFMMGGFRNVQSRSMFIQTETTPNDDSLKFIPGVPVMQNNSTIEFTDTKSSLKSPLALRLMGIEGVKTIFYGPDFISISKDSSIAWSILKPEIYSILMEFFSSGKQKLFKSEEDRESFEEGNQDTKILDSDSETVAMIKELLETRVRPAIMEDGGDIEYRGFDEETGLVQVKLKGSCRGCSSSTVTLKSGIERMLMHYIPEVKGVEQILDQEEQIAIDEFNKLEKKLGHGSEKKSESNNADSPMAQYMSV